MSLKKIILKIFALFSVIRGYNLIVLIIAQYLSILFIFAPNVEHRELLTNLKLNGIIFCSTLSIAAGYIINNFYDLEKDEINRPLQVYLQNQVSQGFKFSVYILLNIFALIASLLISFKLFIFFLIYQFLIWFYSHKINKLAIIKNFYLVIIRIFPFFGLLIYFDNLSINLILHSVFLTILLLLTDITKDLNSQKADLLYNYNSIPIKYGIKITKIIISSLIIIQLIIGVLIIMKNNIGAMRYFFIISNFLFLSILSTIWKLKTLGYYKILYYLFKGMVVLGVFSIALIEINPLTL